VKILAIEIGSIGLVPWNLKQLLSSFSVVTIIVVVVTFILKPPT
jgi:hypothetical protein